MRARQVLNLAYVFDFDDSIVTTDSKTHVYDKHSGDFLFSLTPKEFNSYQKKINHVLDTSDFVARDIILRAKPIKKWKKLINLDKKIANGHDNITLYILTARAPVTQKHIYDFLRSQGILNLSLGNIIAMGDGKGEIDVPSEKVKVLKRIQKESDIVVFYDDNEKNIKAAQSVGIDAMLVEEYIK